MLNNRLRQLREEHDFSQEEIAKILGKSQKTISSWEKGRTNPKMKDLNQLCTLYDCTYEYLTGIKQHSPNDITIDDILIRITHCNNEELKTIRDQIDFVIQSNNRLAEIEAEKARLERELEYVKHFQQQYINKTAPGISGSGVDE
jgi:transcriptional regulator with XRE-family HTH domain